MVNQSPREHSPAPDERLDGAVARLLDAAAAPVEPGPQPGEEQALAAFRASHRTRRIPMFSHPTRAKAAVAATIGAGTLLFAGVGGAAAAGVLPDHAQNTASTVLSGLGLDVPRADDRAGTHPADLGAEDEAATEDATEESTVETDEVDTTDVEDTDETGDPADPEANDHGQAVSGVAKATESGPGKGATVSETASSKSKAGEDHGKPEQPGSQAESHKPATGDDSAEEQGDDTSDQEADGPSTADEKSGGRSHAGSDKARP